MIVLNLSNEENEMFLTIFTPTYNRKNLLPRLFESLKAQSDYDFEWLIIDDGSSDGTDGYFKTIIDKAPFTIRYFRQTNQGKHVAFNKAILEAKGTAFLCVDSDDYLIRNAVQVIKESWQIPADCAGIMALKKYENEEILGTVFPDSINKASLYELSCILKYPGERTLIYQTSVLSYYQFPVFPSEKFMTECVLYDQIDQKYKMLLLNIPITVCEYQNNGLSNNLRQIQINNPKGTALFYKNRIKMSKSVFETIKNYIRYSSFLIIVEKDSRNLIGKAGLINLLIGNVGKKYYLSKAKGGGTTQINENS